MGHQHEMTVATTAPREQVWAVLTDLSGWPSWTGSVSEVAVESDELAVGTEARVTQPGLPATAWTVTEVTPGRAFTWQSRHDGIVTTATHEIRETEGGTEVVLGVDHVGVASPLAQRLAAAKTRRFLWMEARGLKARVEGSVAAC